MRPAELTERFVRGMAVGSNEITDVADVTDVTERTVLIPPGG